MTGVNPLVTAKELAEIMQVSERTALQHIKEHPRCVNVGIGDEKGRYRLPYSVLVAVSEGEETMRNKPSKQPPPKAKPRTVTNPREGQRAKNGRLYAAKRK